MKKLLYGLLRMHFLDFTKRVDISNKFVKEFAEFEQKVFKNEDTIDNQPHTNENFNTLHDFLINIYNSQFIPTEYIPKGSALLGKTEFNKLAFVKEFLSEFDLAVFDYQKESDIPVATKDINYIIINNCDDLLKSKNTLTFFTNIPKKLKIHYILLGEENGVPELLAEDENLIPLVDKFFKAIAFYELN